MNTFEQNKTGETSDYQRCLNKAVARTRDLLVSESGGSGYDEIHAVKSVLYAAIERTGMSAERMMTVHRKLRELLLLVSIRSDASLTERQEAFRIIEELKMQAYHPGE